MRLVLLGSDTFAAPLRALGHEAQVCGLTGDIAISDHDAEWARVETLLKKVGFRPDAVLVTDNVGNRQLPCGLAEASIITAFYGVDSPLNRFWQEPYAQLFDLAFLDQPDEATRLGKLHPGAYWLPVGVEPGLYQVKPEPNELPGVCFVGVVDENVRPKRSALLAKVEKISPLAVRGGRNDAWFPTQKAAQLYASHQITLNENLFPGLTTRPLEVMASGGCLLSEAAPGSMDLYFKNLEHLSYFGPDDLEDKLNQLLKDDGLRAKLRRQGREIVLESHTLKDRARLIVERIESVMSGSQKICRARGGEALRLEGEALLMAGLRWPAKAGERRVMRGAMRLRAAAADGAKPLPASLNAGLAELSLGRLDEALIHLRRAGELGGAREGLAWALTAWQAGRHDEFVQQRKKLGMLGYPGEGSFHIDAARLLADEGQAAGIGFNRSRLNAAFWTGLEHLLESTGREANQGQAWELLGDLLFSQGAPNQAAQAYDRAWHLAARSELGKKRTRAAQRGYML